MALDREANTRVRHHEVMEQTQDHRTAHAHKFAPKPSPMMPKKHFDETDTEKEERLTRNEAAWPSSVPTPPDCPNLDLTTSNARTCGTEMET
jgi:hypothetical protein